MAQGPGAADAKKASSQKEVVHLGQGSVSLVRFPEEVVSLGLTDSANFQADIAVRDPRAIRLTVLTAQARTASLLIVTKGGHQLALRLVNVGALPGNENVDPAVEYRLAADGGGLERSLPQAAQVSQPLQVKRQMQAPPAIAISRPPAQNKNVAAEPLPPRAETQLKPAPTQTAEARPPVAAQPVADVVPIIQQAPPSPNEPSGSATASNQKASLTSAASEQAAPPALRNVAGIFDKRKPETSTSVETPAPSTPSPESHADLVGGSPALLIGPGDLLEVSVYGAPELGQKVRVSSSGDIVLPLINAVHVAGLTAEQAQTQIEGKLAAGQFLNAPNVTVFLSEYATQGASVLGEVAKPGVYPVLGARRLFDLISVAGGFTSKAGNLISITHRGEPTPIHLHLSKDPVKAAEANIPILPADTILVSKAGIVYVVGNVNKPGGFILDKDSSLTVLQSIALAEGTRPNSKINSTVLIRKTPNGTQQIPIHLKKIMESKAPDMPLQPDDVVFIPNSASRTMIKRGAESILQVATGVAIYRF